MPISLSHIRLWFKMLTGRSILHVHQDLGKCFSTKEIKGYYNDMTEKVTRLPHLLQTNGLPTLSVSKDKRIEFAVGIFQYGLGAYDLYLTTGDEIYKKKFLQCVEWAYQHQEASGAWNTFQHIYPAHPYGAMSQGEGASLLLRGFTHEKKPEYLKAAQKGIDFMLKPITDGGTTLYEGDDVIFREYVHRPAVLNGWVFAWFGLYDYVLTTHDESNYKNLLNHSCDTLLRRLPQLSTWYWSKYDFDSRIASPFYHRLHIALMQALYQMTGAETFGMYAEKWAKDACNPLKKSMAFIYKASQKVVEKKVP